MDYCEQNINTNVTGFSIQWFHNQGCNQLVEDGGLG